MQCGVSCNRTKIKYVMLGHEGQKFDSMKVAKVMYKSMNVENPALSEQIFLERVLETYLFPMGFFRELNIAKGGKF